MISQIRRMVKLHGYRFIFGISILSLALLVAWWSVFLTQSIGRQRTLLRENLTARLDYFALQLTTSGSEFPGTGMLPQDERFEIVPGDRESRPFVKLLKSSRPPLCLRVREAALEQIEDEFKRKRFMLIGESSLLVLLLLFCSILLYKFIRLEKRSTEEIEEFWGRMTHEIKTPITGIKAFLQSLKNRSLDESQVSTLVDMALQEVEKQEQLAENILAGSSLKRKDVALKLVDLNIGKFLENYFAGHILYLSGVKVRLDIDKKKGLLATADPHALKITLDNITDNAVKYCSPGLVLHVSISRQGPRAVIRIGDNGPGIKPEVLKNIFNAYTHFADDLPAACRGIGMGLYISKKLAKKMGGDLDAISSGEGQGAEFRVFLPVGKNDKT